MLFSLSFFILAFYLDLKSFDVKVGFCPGSIIRYNAILANSPYSVEDAHLCNVFEQDIRSLDEVSKKLLYLISLI